jgi:hypothetical protein
MTDKTNNKTSLTSIGIDRQTNNLIDKLCKRYSLKKGEIVRLAFAYLDKACINPAEAPESTKAELSKINKRQDDLIRFIRNYEEKELNPMIRATNSIALRFEKVVEGINKILRAEIEQSRELQNNVLKKISEVFGQHADVINNQGKQINNFTKIQQRDNKRLFQLIYLYSELASCGVMDGKRKENLKTEIINLINEK